MESKIHELYTKQFEVVGELFEEAMNIARDKDISLDDLKHYGLGWLEGVQIDCIFNGGTCERIGYRFVIGDVTFDHIVAKDSCGNLLDYNGSDNINTSYGKALTRLNRVIANLIQILWIKGCPV